MSGTGEQRAVSWVRPLRVAALVKQIPVGESLALGPDNRLVRSGLALEMNAYCRRAVTQGVELAQRTGGTCTVVTLGPESAEDVLREAIAWGASDGLHLCDRAFAGSDTLATARALAAVLRAEGPFDLILVGRNSLDGDTGQVGPQLAELLGLPFATGIRELALEGEVLSLQLELDDGSQDVEVSLPALLSVAERLCEPCKVPPEGRAAVNSHLIRRVGARELGGGPWGAIGSPTQVGQTRLLHHDRAGQILQGTVAEQVAEAVELLTVRRALVPSAQPAPVQLAATPERPDADCRVVAVLVEPDRPQVAAELLGAASALAADDGSAVHALCVAAEDPGGLGAWGADRVTVFSGSTLAEDVAAAVVEWAAGHALWAVLGPSTTFGREVLGRMAVALDAGLVGDAIGVTRVDGQLVAAKPAFAGALVADISCTSPVSLVSIRPGVLPLPANAVRMPDVTTMSTPSLSRIRLLRTSRDDDVEVLSRADAVIGVGAAVRPDEYEELTTLAAVLGAELAATRKVTDQGWAPRARQVGITGRSISPRLYVALGTSGKFNHMVGVRAAGTILAINNDPNALVLDHCDIGIVGDWHEVVPALATAVRHLQQRTN
jgi:electron transfer flavoprotein alpha subunit